MTATGRVPELDGLRGLAILAVMSFHFFWFPYHSDILPAADSSPLRWLAAAQLSGWCGVDLFFVLSGYLITGILADGRQKTDFFRRFYWRRLLRIFPAYYLLLILWPLIRHLYPAEAFASANPGYPAWLWTYTANILLAQHGWGAVPMPLRHLWSLCIEEQYYLLWPLAIHVLERRQAIALCGILLVFAPALRFLLQHWYPPPGAGYLLMPARMDALAAGSLVALLRREEGLTARLQAWLRSGLLVSAVALVALFLLRGGLKGEDPLVSTIGLTLLALFFAGVVAYSGMAAESAGVRRMLRHRLLQWFGRYSYGMYLWHQPICVLVLSSGFLAMLERAYAPHAMWLLILLCYAVPLLLTIAMASISWYCLEQPLLRLKERLGTPG